jgi:hypothetical protein
MSWQLTGQPIFISISSFLSLFAPRGVKLVLRTYFEVVLVVRSNGVMKRLDRHVASDVMEQLFRSYHHTLKHCRRRSSGITRLLERVTQVLIEWRHNPNFSPEIGRV